MPKIGQPFSPEILSLLTRRIEGERDRGLRAAIADRQFRDTAKNRLLKRMLSREGNAADVEKARLAAQSRGRGGSSLGPQDLALAKLREEQRRDLVETRPARIQAQEALGGQRGAREREIIEKLPAEVQRILAEAGLDAERIEDLSERRPSRIRRDEAGAAFSEAGAELSTERAETERSTRQPDIDRTEALTEESRARVRDIESRIQDREVRQGLRQVEQEFSQAVQAGRLENQSLQLLIKLVNLQTKTDPRFGDLVIEQNPEAAELIERMQSSIISNLSGEQRRRALQTVRNERREKLQEGGGSVSPAEQDEPIEDQLSRLLDALDSSR